MESAAPSTHAMKSAIPANLSPMIPPAMTACSAMASKHATPLRAAFLLRPLTVRASIRSASRVFATKPQTPALNRIYRTVSPATTATAALRAIRVSSVPALAAEHLAATASLSASAAKPVSLRAVGPVTRVAAVFAVTVSSIPEKPVILPRTMSATTARTMIQTG